MHDTICIKRIPDSSQIGVFPVADSILRLDLPAIIIPVDHFALEGPPCPGNRHSAHIGGMSMGAARAQRALKKAISFDADDIILVNDVSFTNVDITPVGASTACGNVVHSSRE